VQATILGGVPFGLKRAAIYCFVFLITAVAAIFSGVAYQIEQRFDWSIGFKFRSLVGQSPILSEDLVIIGMDDISVASQQLTELNLRSWSFVLRGIAAMNPKIILIDKIFNSPLRPQLPQSFIDEVSGIPLVAGAIVADAPIDGRPILAMNRPEFSPKKYFDPANPPSSLANLLTSVRKTKRFPYGPNPQFIDAFHQLGHIQLDENNTIKSFEFSAPDRLIPHFSFFAATKIGFDSKDDFYIDNKPVSLDDNGRLPINIASLEQIRSKIIRMDKLIDAIANSQNIPGIKAGDTVLFLPNLYTGGGDIKQTPLGNMPGGYLQASMINSVLTGNWIKFLPKWVLLAYVITISLLFVFLSSRYNPLCLGFCAVAISIATILLSILLFTYHAVTGPGIFLGSWAGVLGFILAFEKARISAAQIERLTVSLGGKISPKEISEIVRNHQIMDRSPSVQTLTVMFIDLVGFSKLAENISAPDLFVQLKLKLNEIRETIYKHGGYVDRTLGDGMLCYFGFRYLSSDTAINHAEQALKCAKSLQLQNLKTNLAEMNAGRIIYPMRIGINTTTACVGDLGDNKRVDFTAIGNGVNFTKRLESACGYYRVMVSDSTRNLLSDDFVETEKGRLNGRMVQIKHHSDLKNAYEFDPVPSSADEAVTVLRYFWSTLGLQRAEDRLIIPNDSRIKVNGKYVNGYVSNFSNNGLALILNEYIADGAVVSFSIDDQSGSLSEQLRSRDLQTIYAEVRWGMPQGDKFLHGVVFRGLTPNSTKFLFETFNASLSRLS